MMLSRITTRTWCFYYRLCSRHFRRWCLNLVGGEWPVSLEISKQKLEKCWTWSLFGGDWLHKSCHLTNISTFGHFCETAITPRFIGADRGEVELFARCCLMWIVTEITETLIVIRVENLPFCSCHSSRDRILAVFHLSFRLLHYSPAPFKGKEKLKWGLTKDYFGNRLIVYQKVHRNVFF